MAASPAGRRPGARRRSDGESGAAAAAQATLSGKPLNGSGWQLPLRAVRMLAHLKEAGTTDVELHLHGTITTVVKVEGLPVDADGNRIEVVAPAHAAAAPVEAPAEEAEEAEEEPEDDKPAKAGKPAKKKHK